MQLKPTLSNRRLLPQVMPLRLAVSLVALSLLVSGLPVFGLLAMPAAQARYFYSPNNPPTSQSGTGNKTPASASTPIKPSNSGPKVKPREPIQKRQKVQSRANIQGRP